MIVITATRVEGGLVFFRQTLSDTETEHYSLSGAEITHNVSGDKQPVTTLYPTQDQPVTTSTPP